MTQPEEFHDVLEQLGALAPGKGEAPRPPGQMLAHIRSALPAEQETTSHWRLPQMLNRKATFAGVMLLLVIVALAFPSVRLAASEFLGLFRVQKFAAVSVSPRQLAVLERVSEEGLFPGEIEMLHEPGLPHTLANIAEATLIAGYRVRTPAALDGPVAVRMTDGTRGRLTVNLTGARAILRAAEVDPFLLPDSLEGAEVDVTVHPVFEQEWAGGVVLIQTQSPVVDYPDDVDTTVLGEALLQFLGMAPGEARRLAQSIDWTNTVLLPVPQDLATFNEVRVDGVSGLALSSLEGQHSTIMWEKDGIVYMILGENLDVNALRDIADSLK